jgi:hypothetical protein
MARRLQNVDSEMTSNTLIALHELYLLLGEQRAELESTP